MFYRVSINITSVKTADSALEAANQALMSQTNPSRAHASQSVEEDTKVVITVTSGRFSPPRFTGNPPTAKAT